MTKSKKENEGGGGGGGEEKAMEENLVECGFKEKWGHVFSVKLLEP